MVRGVFRHGSKPPLTDAVTARLGKRGSLAICFDPLTLTYREIWTDGFVEHTEHRWGLTSGIRLDGRPLLTTVPSVGWSRDGKWRPSYPDGAVDYRGYYRHGKRVVFDYVVQGVRVLESPWAIRTDHGPMLTRTVRIRDDVGKRQLQLFQGRGKTERRTVKGHEVLLLRHGKRATACRLRTADLQGKATLRVTADHRVTVALSDIQAGSRFTAYVWTGPAGDVDAAAKAIAATRSPADPAELRRGDPGRWPKTVTLSGERGDDSKPYPIDRIPVPIENPYKTLMFLSGIDFFDNGDAAVSTITGDVWRVSGLDADLDEVTWKRYASGLNQPLGLVMVDNEPMVLCRDQITHLHDRNGDDEADFYETFSDAYPSPAGGHSFLTGLRRDAEGNYYFSSQTPGVMRISPDGERATRIARGLRNPNGLDVRPDGTVFTAPQEGTWTPTSMIVRIAEKGRFFGLWPKRNQKITRPLCFVPRNVDPSTGGQCFVEGDGFGPLSDQLLSFSWNHCSYYAVLRDRVDGVSQGAAVPLPGAFRAGAHRARVRPADGHLYVACSDGWGTYAVQHGALHRVRYTGKKASLPTDFHAHRNGLTITFSRRLDPSVAENPSRYFAQQWEYVYSKSYGSPEYSVRHPEKKGHDPLTIRSAHLLDDGRTVFLEIPRIRPVMQMHVHAKLTAEDGERFTADLFPTLRRLGEPFRGFDGYEPVETSKPEKLALRVRRPEQKKNKSGKKDRPKSGRRIVIKAINGLNYNKEKIRVRAGERISLVLKNTTVLPHNLVVTRPGRMRAVGRAADTLIGDPKGVKRAYVPDRDDVLFHTDVVRPSKTATLHFTAPEEPGDYPYICTFPGHWRVMNGTMVVEPKESGNKG